MDENDEIIDVNKFNDIWNKIDELLATETFNDTWNDYANYICDNDIELWGIINEFPNYEASTLGNARVLVSNRVGRANIPTVLKQEDSNGYSRVTLKNGKLRSAKGIHRFVALAFIPNHDANKTEIDHIDMNKKNNKINNLRWCSHDENMEYYKKHIEYKGKVICQYDLNNNLVQKWDDLREILKENSDYKIDRMYHAFNEKSKSQYGYIWRYEDKNEIKIQDDENFKKMGNYANGDYSSFELSNYGNVRNIKRNNILSGNMDNNYKSVCLRDNITKKGIYFKIDRLVGDFFLDGKTEEKNIILHKDGNKLNNKSDNLEWATSEQLMKAKCGVKIRQLDLETGDEIAIFNSIMEACEKNNLDGNKRIGVSKCCRGINKTAFGYKWEYVN